MRLENDILFFDEGEAVIQDGCLIIQKREVTEDGTDSKTDEVL